jgi:phosphoribosylglycinamide formyltransferase-1
MSNIAIFASGSGTNAENIIQYFQNNNKSENTVKLVLSNKIQAKVHDRAKKLGVTSIAFSRDDFYKSNNVINILKKYNIDFIVLAGFLWLVPKSLIKAFDGKIVNIHPALLPKYGGKGMYGDFVHKAVIEAKEKESGITIHWVNENYDEGNTIFQAKCEITENDTPESLAQKIHKLEYQHFPQIIEKVLDEQ